MEWISVTDKLPNSGELRGKEILVLVNGKIFICSVLDDGFMYVNDNRFFYDARLGWCGDPRFAKPTHWMLIPDPPEVSR